MSTPALSNIELFHQVRWLNDSLKDYYVNNVYWVVEGTLLIRLHHPSNPERRLVLDRGRAIWVTEAKLEGERTDNLLNLFRKKLSRGKILSISQLGTERIIVIEFIGCGATKLVAEFFSSGNLILLDDKDVILAALEYHETRDRSIVLGVKYVPPPQRGADPLAVDEEFLKPLLEYQDDFRKWLGKNLSLPKKYIDTLPALLNLPAGSTGKEISEQTLRSLITAIRGFFSEDFKIRPVLYFDGEEPVDFSIYSTGPNQYEIKEVGSLNEALDKLYTRSCLKKREQALLHPMYRVREGLKNTMEGLNKKKEVIAEDKKVLTEIANSIIESISLYYQNKDQFLKLFKSGIISLSDDIIKISYKNFEFELDQLNPMKTRSEIFNATKVLSQEMLDIDSSLIKLEKDLVQIEKKIELKESNVVKGSHKIFEKEWFERYRWFRTSEGFLAIGGRDASSNEALIKKYLGDEDIVFHAEFTGAPFFIVKEGKRATEPSVRETALASVAFSNIWKLGIASGEAYWVFKDQISKQAPSGQYVGRGAFMISGKRNYVKNIPLELAVAITKVKDHYSVVSGPMGAVKAYAEVYVEILPGREERNYAAKKIKAVLLQKMNFLEDVRNIPLEDFTLSLPPGGCKIKS
jgi:predicted ribosome quality control (RQC) complex YloA/Tae2 family protein